MDSKTETPTEMGEQDKTTLNQEIQEDQGNSISKSESEDSQTNETDGAAQAGEQRSTSPTPPPPLPKDDKYGTTTSTNVASTTQSSSELKDELQSGQEVWDEKSGLGEYNMESTDGDFDEKRPQEVNGETRSEIRNIMEQFKDHDGSLSEGVTSPTGSNLPVFQYPPRVSSLENLSKSDSKHTSFDESGNKNNDSASASINEKDIDRLSLSRAPSVVSQPPLPEPDPEPSLPFDFHRFLEQLRHRTADPVAKFLRSFLAEFGKRQWMVHEQVKIISDFLSFIGNKMAQCEVWRSVSDAEFDNAREGMEKLVMNRLYTQTFSPEIPPPEPVKNRRKGAPPVLGPGRRGQHQEDVERDEVLAQKVRIYGWVQEQHLDIPSFGDKGRKFLVLAQQELSKIRSYRAPRDKIICVLNCCKVLFGFLRNAQSDQSADTFIPLLIYTVLKANPEHLVSNVQYILRFRNQDKLSGEAGYYMSSLMGAVQFIENLDRTNLTVSDDEFEKNVEQAVSAIAERHSAEEKRGSTSVMPISEKSALSRPEVTPRNSMDAERAAAPRRNSARPVGSQSEASVAETDEENAAVAGLLRTIQKPLSTIGRIFSEDSSSQSRDRPPGTPLPGTTPRGSPSAAQQSRQPHNVPPGAAEEVHRNRMVAEEAAARQASAESAEMQTRQRAEHDTVVETLAGMFPDLDKEVISDVVRQKEGRVGLAVDACLALSH